MSNTWYQMWVSRENALKIMKLYCEPILQKFECCPFAPNGIPIQEADGTIEVRAYNLIRFNMAKSYLKDQGFIIEREQTNEEDE